MPRQKGDRGKLTPARQEKLLSYVRQGCTLRAAALKAGIHERTFYLWREKGEKARTGKYREFVDALEEAQAHAEVALVTSLKLQGAEDWRALAWMLERRFPEAWAKQQIVENRHADSDGGPLPTPTLTINFADATPEQLAALAGVDLDDPDA
jgi:hypothetical protein